MARLVPLKKKPAVAGTKTAPPSGVTSPPAVGGPKQPLAFETPGFDEWTKQVAGLPAEDQVKAVMKKLQDLNQGFDGKETHGIENGIVTVLAFSSDNVSDISPVRALAGLRIVSCLGSSVRKGQLADLSPLKGLALTTLVCADNPVSDLSPLQGMSLTQINIAYTQVSDLSALKGMPLTILRGEASKMIDLSPLNGMDLAFFDCSDTQVTDLSPLREMPLATLRIGRIPVSDLSPLKNVRISDLVHDFKPFRDKELLRSLKSLQTINGKPVAEFWKEVDAQQAAFDAWTKQVAAMPAEDQVKAVVKKLQELNQGFDGKETHQIENDVVVGLQFVTDEVTDISPVRALAGLKSLSCPGTLTAKANGKLVDLSPLKGMRLTTLNCIGTQVSDLSPLKGMPLTWLAFTLAPVSDLSPLSGMPLTVLDFHSSQVSDLSPLKGMSLTHLQFDGTKVTDISPLLGMPLKGLIFDFQPERDTELLRSIKTLETINGKPAAEFWKEVESKK